MSILTTLINPKRIELSATVTRADGTVENHGIVAFYHKNPVLQLLWNIKQFLKGK